MRINRLFMTLLVWHFVVTQAGVTRRDSLVISEDITTPLRDSRKVFQGHRKRQAGRQRGRDSGADGSGRQQPRPGGRLDAAPNGAAATDRTREQEPRPTAQGGPSPRGGVGADRRPDAGQEGDRGREGQAKASGAAPHGGPTRGRSQESAADPYGGRIRERTRPSQSDRYSGREGSNRERSREDGSERQLQAPAQRESGARVDAVGGQRSPNINVGAQRAPVLGKSPQHMTPASTKSHSTPSRNEKSASKQRSKDLASISKSLPGAASNAAAGETEDANPWRETNKGDKGVPTHGQKQPPGSKPPPGPPKSSASGDHESAGGSKKQVPTGDRKQPGGSKPPSGTKKPASTGSKKQPDGSKTPADKTSKASDETNKAKNQNEGNKNSPAKASDDKAPGKSVNWRTLPISVLSKKFPNKVPIVESEASGLAGRMIPTKPSEWEESAERGKNAPLIARPVPLAGDIPMDEDG